MSEFWAALTIPQANVLAAFFTMLAAIVAIVAGGLFFERKVNSLKDAIKTTERDLAEHISKLQTAIASVKENILEKVSEIEEITLLTGGRAASESGKDIGTEIVGGDEAGAVAEPLVEPRARFLSAWEAIRKLLETTVSDDKIDGRTRAKYLRIDRRSYRELISVMLRDGLLTKLEAELDRAVTLRNQIKRGRQEVTKELAEEMESLRDRILNPI
jgi:gas vesicle protein